MPIDQLKFFCLMITGFPLLQPFAFFLLVSTVSIVTCFLVLVLSINVATNPSESIISLTGTYGSGSLVSPLSVAPCFVDSIFWCKRALKFNNLGPHTLLTTTLMFVFTHEKIFPMLCVLNLRYLSC